MNNLGLLAVMQPRPISERWDQSTARHWAGVLATFPLFMEISKRRLRRLARHATCAEFAPGETIIFAGDRGGFLYLILSGKIKAGSTPASRTLGSGDYFGELAASDSGPQSTPIVALTYAYIMKLPAPSVVSFTRRHPAITLRMLGDLTTRLRHLETRAARAA
jgi:CRP-like cAMP-binding protein